MLIYKDVFTGDELCSDSFPMKLVDDLIFEFKGRHVVRKEGEVRLEGANASAEEADEGSDELVERGIDFVLNHRLQEMNCYEDMPMFKAYIKEFMKKIIGYLEKEGKSKEEVDTFKKKIQAWVVALLNKDRWKSLQFFIGEKQAEGHGEGQVCIVEFRDEADRKHPYMMLIKAATTRLDEATARTLTRLQAEIAELRYVKLVLATYDNFGFILFLQPSKRPISKLNLYAEIFDDILKYFTCDTIKPTLFLVSRTMARLGYSQVVRQYKKQLLGSTEGNPPERALKEEKC